ncbi:hypothetical protein FRACA_350003 [Frankia canadensis]|uniref:Uncharacterized protein n=1 Tax=Frankia canadensis TaxID=1836972 RepID=A0A2I2KV85_9ACTN|nr:hypothetical protein FRACA_350003 [Frankia canadensis]SOU56869.1 hypothetical protein FRACA_350003 [Frankia canadensis]
MLADRVDGRAGQMGEGGQGDPGQPALPRRIREGAVHGRPDRGDATDARVVQRAPQREMAAEAQHHREGPAGVGPAVERVEQAGEKTPAAIVVRNGAGAGPRHIRDYSADAEKPHAQQHGGPLLLGADYSPHQHHERPLRPGFASGESACPAGDGTAVDRQGELLQIDVPVGPPAAELRDGQLQGALAARPVDIGEPGHRVQAGGQQRPAPLGLSAGGGAPFRGPGTGTLTVMGDAGEDIALDAVGNTLRASVDSGENPEFLDVVHCVSILRSAAARTPSQPGSPLYGACGRVFRRSSSGDFLKPN